MCQLKVALFTLTVAILVGGCATAPTTESGRTSLSLETQQAIADFKKEDPDIARFFNNSAGYAVFPGVGKGAIGVGGAYGKGELYERGQLVGYCDLSQGTIGFQLGGQKYSEIIFFEDKPALDRFKSGNFAFAAQASAVALKSGASANAKYAGGVAVFTRAVGGLMYEASIGGQKFSYLPK